MTDCFCGIGHFPSSDKTDLWSPFDKVVLSSGSFLPFSFDSYLYVLVPFLFFPAYFSGSARLFDT